ncbi:uncharacterized protein LOC132203048 isoform X2 [Neocloeon triangulifer]|uniref:uncharacterized protein LOC132203048 isoform X2 n=1 Tax=Neocloeon triangulifer TaxID=2078957 RepID=UPI00286F149C|nr:uncharacterized protein LOC132203048 isoform X2 [Neocloeon triangulifer]
MLIVAMKGFVFLVLMVTLKTAVWSQQQNEADDFCVLKADLIMENLKLRNVHYGENFSEISEEKFETLRDLIGEISSTQKKFQSTLDKLQLMTENLQLEMSSVINKIDTTTISKCHKSKDLSNIVHFKTGSFYIHYTISRHTWNEAQEFCGKFNMRLVIIDSEQKLEDLTELIKTNSTGSSALRYRLSYWVGANDIGREPGDFKWTNGDEINRKLPARLFTSQHKNETCLRMTYCHKARKYELTDLSCSSYIYFICEILPECIPNLLKS